MFFRIRGLFLFLLVLSGCTEPPYTNLDNTQLKNMIEQGVPVYDVRRDDEWKETGVIKGSRLLTIITREARVNPNFISTFTQAIDKNSPVILICRTGSRTRKLATHLVEQLGYTKIYNVRDGITGWMSEGNPVTRTRF